MGQSSSGIWKATAKLVRSFSLERAKLLPPLPRDWDLTQALSRALKGPPLVDPGKETAAPSIPRQWEQDLPVKQTKTRMYHITAVGQWREPHLEMSQPFWLEDLSVHIYAFAVGRRSSVDKLFLLLSFAQAYFPGTNLNINNYLYFLDYTKSQGIFEEMLP